jgi:hypothetical protein
MEPDAINDLWGRITRASDPLAKFRTCNRVTACIYPKPFEGKSEVVRWFYSRNNGCQVFFACSKEVSDKIEQDSWAEVSYDFTVYVEHELMPYCVQNTDWQKCARYGIEYDKKLTKKSAQSCGNDFGCEGTMCNCEPFGQGDFTYGIAEADEFELLSKELNAKTERRKSAKSGNQTTTT